MSHICRTWFGSSLFAILLKYCYISIRNEMGALLETGSLGVSPYKHWRIYLSKEIHCTLLFHNEPSSSFLIVLTLFIILYYRELSSDLLQLLILSQHTPIRDRYIKKIILNRQGFSKCTKLLREVITTVRFGPKTYCIFGCVPCETLLGCSWNLNEWSHYKFDEDIRKLL